MRHSVGLERHSLLHEILNLQGVTQCSNICLLTFTFLHITNSEKHLDLGHLATSFCLLKLPKMPELAKIHTKVYFRPEPNIEFYKIPYEDKKREKARQLRLADDARNEG